MPNRNVHVPVGMASGLAYSLYLTQDQQENDRFFEVLGGVLGGYCGGRLPDVFEPANSSMHRAFAHSTTTGAAFVLSAHTAAQEWGIFFREKATDLRRRRQTNRMSDVDLTINVFLEILLRVAAGMGPGLLAGYASHLALDACTPRSLPLV
ncbi:MAG: metal-dependent hydrolase [Nitrospirota bacterium]